MQQPIYNRILFVFSFIGLLIAGYLWKMHATPQDIPCGPSNGCADVALSPYSRFPFGSGPPVAAYGTVGYLLFATLAFVRTLPAFDTPARSRNLLLLIVAGAALGSFASLGLTYLELFVIKAICKWCVASQTIILLILGVALTEYRKQNKQATLEPQPV